MGKAMQIKATSGTGSAGLGIVGTGLALALPRAEWIGWVLVAAGLIVLVFDIRIERGQIAVGSPESLLGRLRRMWPQYLMVFAGCLFFVGFVGFLQNNVEEKPPTKEQKPATSTEPRKSAGILLLSAEGKVASRAIEIGDSGLKFNAFSFFGVSKLKIELVEGVAKVSTDVRDDKGALIGEIVQNKWMVKPDKTWDFNYNDSALEVKNPQGRIVLQVRVLPDTIQIQGEWWSAQGDGVRVLKVPEGGMKVIRFNRDSNPDDDIWPKIQPIFEYPSELSLGKLLVPDKKLPGFAAYAVLRIYDVPEFRRKYIFDFGAQNSKARAAFYLSASDQFTFVLTDVRGESYPLEVKLGHGGVPIDKFIMLLCEAGVDGDTTVLRVSVNGKEIQQRKLSFAVDLGDRKWGPGTTLGANAMGQDNGVFMLMELGAWAETFSKQDTAKMLKNVTDFHKLKID